MLVASMRAGGARVGIGELLAARRALSALDPANHETAYLALRASLCSRDDDIAPFDAAFAEWFSTPTLLQDKDFAEYSEAECHAARAVMRRLAGAGPARPSRRTRPARRRGPRPLAARPDLRRTIRSSLRTGGDPFERHWREAGDRPRPLVLVCDASGPMEPYARMLLQYTQACLAARRPVEAFVFGTRLTRVTVELRGGDPDRALDRAAGAASDLSGATRMGEALGALNREHGRRVVRGAIVVLLSDGWDRGDPEQLSLEMGWLGREAHSLVWLNPLSNGMPGALPHVHHCLAGNSLASLEELARLMDDGLE
jgi:uncharacterized protein